MSSKSNAFVLLYAVVATAITVLFLFVDKGHLGGQLANAGMAFPLATSDLLDKVSMHGDVLAFVAIAVTGLIASMYMQNGQPLLVIGTLASFVVLTAHQELPMVRYMTLGAVLFAIGIYGMVVSRNAVRMLMAIELMINAANINFVTFARYMDPVAAKGQIFAIFVLTVAAAEAAVGLAIVLAIYRNMASVDMEKFNLLKW